VSLAAGIDVRRFSWIRPLVADYADNFDAVASLYAGDPRRPDAWRRAIERAQTHGRRRDDLAALIGRQQAHRGAPRPAQEAGARLADPASVAVVTGQQAGAFGGPLYTLLKAITAIQLARKAEAEHRVPVVPVFWVEAEDHDWEEVRRITILDAEFQPRSLELDPPDGAGQLPIGSLILDDRVGATIDALGGTLAGSDFTAGVIDTLRASWRAGERMGTAFARWLEALLGTHGLVVFESSDPAAKPLVADLFARELQFPGRSAALASAAGKELTARGHQPQVIPQPDSIALFHLGNGRTPIRAHADGLAIGDEVHDPRALAAEAIERPERFSPNVLLRPIVQDALFPTICYVAGPSELAYLGQLRGIYEHFGVPMPLVYPRASATLVDSAAARFLSKYDVPLEDLQPQDDAGLNRLLESQLPKSVEEALADAQATIGRSMARLIEAMPAVDPTLAGAAKTTLGRMEHDLKSLHGKVIQAAKRRDDTLRRQFQRTQAQVFPGGHPQERTLGVIFFLNRYGPALVDRLLEELPLEMGKHWVMTV
jgi:bacillithiol biosynthesis cysteine-adding enzyme BshC